MLYRKVNVGEKNFVISGLLTSRNVDEIVSTNLNLVQCPSYIS